LTITVATKKPGNIVRFVQMQKEEKEMNISHTLDKSMWKMHNRVLTQGDVMNREYSYGVRKFPLMRVSAKVFRLPGFFYWNALLPILLVTLASLAPFVVDIKIPQSRLPATCTLMLTSVSIRWTIGRLLPTVSYLTSLDKYSLVSMLIITTELLYHGVMGAIFRKIPEKTAYLIDTIAFAVFCFFIFIKQCVFVAWIIKVKLHRRNINRQELVAVTDNDDLSTISTISLDQINCIKDKTVSFKMSNSIGKKSQEQEPMMGEKDNQTQLNE